MKKFAVILLVLFCAFAAFCGGSEEKKTETVVTPVSNVTEVTNVTAVSSPNSPAAEIELYKKTTITKGELEEALKALKEAGQEVNAEEYLQTLIDSELVSQSLEKDEVKVEDLFNRYVLSAATYYGQQTGVEFTSQEDIEKFFVNHGTTLDQFAASLYSSFQAELITSYVQNKFADQFANLPKPEAEAVMNFFEENKALFTNSEKVKIAHIFFYVENDEVASEIKVKADDVYNQIKNGSLTFEKAVTDYTEDNATKDEGGILGWMNLSESEFEKSIGINTSEYHKVLFTEDTFNKLFTLEEGVVSGVLASSQGYHIFKVIKHLPEKTLAVSDKVYPDSDATVYDFCQSYIDEATRSILLEQCYDKMIEDLKAQATIKVY